jgi:mxaA protein
MAAAPISIERQESRLFGYQLGDVIAEINEIRLAPGYRLDAQSLPRIGKRAGWFIVRNAQTRTVAAADGTTVIELRLELQLANSPKNPRMLSVPPFALRFTGPEARVETLPGLTIDAVPLGTGEIRTGMPDVLAPRAPPQIPIAGARAQLKTSAIAAALLGGWLILALAIRRWRPATPRPFAAANRDLRRLAKQALTLDGARAALQRVHRAFDQAAGHRLFGEGAEAYCRRVGADKALSDRTVEFFAQSRELFYRTDAAEVPHSLARDLAALCTAWQRFERRHPR